jgi:chemotaxis protein CheX
MVRLRKAFRGKISKGLYMKAEYINPFVTSTVSVFETMLGCSLTRGKIFIKNGASPEFEVTGIIGLSGKAAGTVVLSLNRETALNAAKTLLGEMPETINADVVDAVGELANMIAGASKAQLEQFEMSLTIPTVIVGKDFSIEFPSKSPPICIPFECKWGPLAVEVGLVELEAPVLV